MDRVGGLFLIIGFILCVIGGWKVLLEVVDSAFVRIVCLLFPLLAVAVLAMNWDKLGELRVSRWILLIGASLLVLGSLMVKFLAPTG